MANLAATNKHLASVAKRKASVYVTVSTSSAIEGIHTPFKRTAASVKQATKSAKSDKASAVKSPDRPRASST